MSTLIVEVCEILDIRNHENADRLEICKIKGWEVITQKGLYKKGQKVVYAPIDSMLPIELSDAMEVTKYLSKGRIKCARLRGFYSQGLIIPLTFLPEGEYEIGTDVKDLLGIVKYEPPPPPAQFAGTQLRKDDRFNRYTDIENIKNFPDVLIEDEIVVISEKIHGCLQSEAKILLADGSVQKIKYIVKNKLKVDVVGRDDKGNIVPSKITNWFTNGSTNDWYKVTFTRKGLGNAYGSLITTKNHLFFCPELNDFLPAIELKPDMDVLCSRYTFDLTYQQEQILIGKMLGDGSLSNSSVIFGHKEQHEDYITYTLLMLGYIAGNKQKDIISGFGTKIKRARTISHDSINDLFISWIDKNKKIVPPIKLSPISLAFWYMDDGSLSHNEDQEDRAILNTCNFDEDSVNNLLIALSNLDIIGTKYQSEGYWRIRLNSKEAHKFFIMIYPYIPECMRYKLPKYFRNAPITPLFDIDNKFEPLSKVQKIINIEKIKSNDSRIRYDIETETGNFFANYVLVHNSNFRCGWVDKDIFLAGSHNCNLKENEDNIYWQIVHKYNLKEKLKNLIGTIIYGEVFGPGIQKKFDYGRKEAELAIFDVSSHNMYLNHTKEMRTVVEKILQLPLVPVLYEGVWKPDLLKLAEGKSALSNICIKEGIVIRPIPERYDSRVGRVILKHISEKYLLKDYGDMH